jgi:excisionase family DNA binding protein
MLREADKLLTVGEVALRLRQAETTVRRKIAEGEIPAVKIGAGPRAPIRVPLEEFQAWLFASDSQSSARATDAASPSPRSGLGEET